MFSSLRAFRMFGCKGLRRNVFPAVHPFRLFTTIGSHQDTDTIYALCSGSLTKTGVSVIRVSGSNAFDAVRALTPSNHSFPTIRKATLRDIIDPNTKELIDKGLVLCFNQGASYTAEDVVEFHLHGSPAVVSAALNALSKLDHFRSAEAGEFTKRAFMNGKMSFVEVEALGDLLNAETEAQRKQAMRGVNGELIDRCWAWRTLLMRSLAHAETIIDFSDDVDDESVQLIDAAKDLKDIRDEMQQLLSGFDRTQLIKNGLRVTLCGPPNAGKSSLLNILVGSNTAIVSSIPGTTRDVLRVDMNLDGYKVILQDTAGLHSAGDEIEKEGIHRAVAAAKESGLQVVLVDITGDVCNEVEQVLSQIKKTQTPTPTPDQIQTNTHTIIVLNKTDLCSEEMVLRQCELIRQHFPDVLHVVPISCKTRHEVSRLTDCMTNVVREMLTTTEGDLPSDLITRERQRNCLEQCVHCITNCINLSEENLVDLQAEELRMSLKALSRLTGDVDVEEILDIVFSDFCIGK